MSDIISERVDGGRLEHFVPTNAFALCLVNDNQEEISCLGILSRPSPYRSSF